MLCSALSTVNGRAIQTNMAKQGAVLETKSDELATEERRRVSREQGQQRRHDSAASMGL